MDTNSNDLNEFIDSLNENEFELALGFYFTIARQFQRSAVLINSSLEVLEFSPAFSKLLDCGHDQLLHKPIADVIAEEDKSRFLKFAAENRSNDIFHLINTKTGAKHVKINACPLITQGREKLLLLDFEELTELERLNFECYRLKSILEQIPLSIIITDTNANIEYVNSQFEKTTGYMAVEVKGLNPRFLQSGYTPPERYQHLWKVITSGKPWRGELQNKKKNGEFFWEMVSISGIRNDEGRLVNYIAVKEDITTRKIVYQQMIESEEQLRLLVESTGDVLYKHNYLTMKFDYLNPAIVKLSGYTAHELNEIGLPSIIQKVEVPDYSRKSTQHAGSHNIYGEKGDYHAEYLIITKSGAQKWIEDHSFPWYDNEGELIGAVGILTDISDRKAMHIELLRAKEESESMNKLKSNFLANISHELRTPLISVLGYSDIVRELTGDDEIRELCNVIHINANRLTETINLILDLTMLEAENESLSLTKSSLADIISSVVESYKDSAAHKKLIFDFTDAVKTPYMVFCEPRMLKQVLNQLINNAFKYTQYGTISIRITGSDEEVVISISDTGIGIRKEDFKIVFDEFRQVSEGLGRSFEGSGLGLNISKRFIEKMDGKIWVESEVGKGSTFSISIKRAL